MLYGAGWERAQGSFTCGVSVISLFLKLLALQPMFLLLYAALKTISLKDIGPRTFCLPCRSLSRPPHHEPWLQRSSQ